ncbi:MAG: UDP-N-acetylmuramoyl-tripeptide--D-alanyl-D-alanine ligase [Alistipes sp.]|nr:UDP-N-acetylmuramoyl-tripeptide--D-alanyl-D-alanine ligase [Alistipes sp.]
MEKLYSFFERTPRITTDSRRDVRDTLFFALHGTSFDGNRYALSALEAGAAGAVIDSPEIFNQASDAQREVLILVDDTLQALQHLAAWHRQQLGIPILAITGSNGKTTTKELVGRTLSQRFRTATTQGNLNNHIGVPLTLLAMDRSIEFGVVEMGASHCGEIAQLCAIAQPNFGLITNIGRAHLEGFGGPEGVMRGKGELLDYLCAHQGTAFCLQESEALQQMIAARPSLQVIHYAASELEGHTTPQGVEVQWGALKIHSALVGEYNLHNMAAALAIGRYFEIPDPQICTAIEHFTPDNNRSQRQRTPHNLLIRDAYNANPSSMHAALENFIHEPSELSKAVILGDMRELGDYAADEHQAIVKMLRENHLTEAYLVGPHFTEAAQGAFHTFPDVQSLAHYLTLHPLTERFLLVKGSHSIGLESLFEQL